MDAESETSPDPQINDNYPRNLNCFIIRHGCPLLEQLIELRTAGWKEKDLKSSLDHHYAKGRQRTDESTSKDDTKWFKTSRGVMKAMDEATRCIPKQTGLRFLDLGCCPGGFSSYVLDKNKSARGTGVSLDVETGGHSLVLGQPERARFEMHWGDLTFYDICSPAHRPAPANKHVLVQTPFSHSDPFQLAILDGHHRRTQESDSTHPWDIDRLLIAQLIISLESLQSGGTLILTLSGIESSKTARIAYMLDNLSQSLVSFKRKGAHATNKMFYAVADGVGRGTNGNKRDDIVAHLKELWWELTFGGPDGAGRWILDDDLDFIITSEALVNIYLDRLINLGRKPWGIQKRALGFSIRKIRDKSARFRGQGVREDTEL